MFETIHKISFDCFVFPRLISLRDERHSTGLTPSISTFPLPSSPGPSPQPFTIPELVLSLTIPGLSGSGCTDLGNLVTFSLFVRPGTSGEVF